MHRNLINEYKNFLFSFQYFLIVFINWTVSVPHSEGVQRETCLFLLIWMRLTESYFYHSFNAYILSKKIPMWQANNSFLYFDKVTLWRNSACPIWPPYEFQIIRRLSLSFTAEIGREQTDLNATGRDFDHPIFNLLIIEKKSLFLKLESLNLLYEKKAIIE